ncbi:MAG: NAD(P)H-dependent oxidoreductase [Saprospiraceae bacterium]|nr:NAD(P)H-dependent oxidoreductase [Saprospiraceae bacterium]
MITVLSGSNRKGSETLRFARQYADFLRKHTDQEVKVLALENIPHDYFFPEMYSSSQQAISLRDIQDEYMIPPGKIVYITSEYNGGFNGALKLFLDACSVREYKATFKGKKAALVGVASGRAGNLRGLEHITGVLNHVGTIVMPNKLPISSIEKLLNDQGDIVDANTLESMEKHALEFLDF